MADLTNELDVGALERDLQGARDALSKLMGVLRTHLALEDDLLLARLMVHADADVRTTAKRFVEEMGGIKAAALANNDRWLDTTAIKADAATFVKETQGILGGLSDRITRENDELYALVDAIS